MRCVVANVKCSVKGNCNIWTLTKKIFWKIFISSIGVHGRRWTNSSTRCDTRKTNDGIFRDKVAKSESVPRWKSVVAFGWRNVSTSVVCAGEGWRFKWINMQPAIKVLSKVLFLPFLVLRLRVCEIKICWRTPFDIHRTYLLLAWLPVARPTKSSVKTITWE